MSVLTKIFVVMLVVLSLLLSAATITFVNSIDDFQLALATQKAAFGSLEAKYATLESASQAEVAQLKTAIGDADRAREALKGQLNDVNAQVATLGSGAAAAESRATVAEGNVNKLTAALQASQATQGQLQQQVTALREETDRLQSQNGDLNVALADATNKLDVTETQRRVTAEQLTELRGQFDKVSGALRDLGQDPARVTSSGLAAGAPAINGVVRATRQINGIPHAQISVGSEDAVKVGMQFNVLDRTTGRFLGKLTIVAVEPNDAVGRLVGPDVTTVAAGAEVRTQL